jgi:hypothetical protein
MFDEGSSEKFRRLTPRPIATPVGYTTTLETKTATLLVRARTKSTATLLPMTFGGGPIQTC